MLLRLTTIIPGTDTTGINLLYAVSPYGWVKVTGKVTGSSKDLLLAKGIKLVV